MDRLSALFARFAPEAKVFYAGKKCLTAQFDAAELDGAHGVGHIHLLRSGRLTLTHGPGETQMLDQPCLLFYPRPCTHLLESTDAVAPAELLCASIDLGPGNPLSHGLPASMILPLHSTPGLKPLLDVVFTEAFTPQCGRQVALDNLLTYLMVVLFRHLIETRHFSAGVFAGLGDPRLAKALTAIHERPGINWTLERLADEAGMSRARFAAHFRETVASTPMEYLGYWRLCLVQQLLKSGRAIKQIAPQVGYQNAGALTRVFHKKIGLTPSAWLAQTQERLAERRVLPDFLHYP